MPVDIDTWRERTGLFNLSQKFNFYSSFQHTLLKLSYYLSFSLTFILTILSLYTELLILHSVLICGNTSSYSDVLILFFFLMKSLLILLSGDIELNPGPKRYFNLKVCHWNLNSLPSHNFAKLTSLQAYNTLHKFDIICISETYLDSSISINDTDLNLDGYKIIRADHPLNLKRGGVCIYFKESLPLNILNVSPLQECLVVEVLYENKKCYLVTLYRSPSQSDIEL